MRASKTTVAPVNRARAGNGTARVDLVSGGLRKVPAQKASVAESRPGPEVVSTVPADADYFVHPFVD